MRRVVLLLAALLAGMACASNGHAQAAPSLPAPWMLVPLNDSKPQTRFELLGLPSSESGGGPVIRATAAGAASMAVHPAGADLASHPWVVWRWRVERQPDQPDISSSSREDAAARLIFFFDGDRSGLPWSDRLVMAAADRLGSRPLPFATLMYVSSPSHEADRVFSNPYTRRIQMIVVDNDPGAAPSSWRSFRRNLRDDYRKVFGGEPGRLIGWALMTDSDNTRSRAQTAYGPVRFQAAP